MAENGNSFKPYVAPDLMMKEFTPRAILLGGIFGVLFGAATVYLALKAGLTVSASIPIAVLAISLGKRYLGTTILENNIIQTTGSAGESIASGVVFTLPAFLFLSTDDATGKSVGFEYFSYWTILTLAIFGGILGVLMMIPLRRSLIVQEHENLPYPEGTACASVLIAGEKGGDFAKPAYLGLAVATGYAVLQHLLHIIAESPSWVTAQKNKYFPSAQLGSDITPEYMGVGYIIGPQIAGMLVSGGVLAWLCLIPLMATLVSPDVIAAQQVKLGFLNDVATAGGRGGWNPDTHTWANTAEALYRAYIRQIGAGAVAAGGLFTLLKSIPTIISAFKGGMASMREKGTVTRSRTENDLSFKLVIFGSIALVVIMAFLPQVPGNNIFYKLLLGLLVIIFGFFFVTVSSRIVGLIGSSNNPVSGMTIATIMATALVFIAVGWTHKFYEPMTLVVGGLICVAAANAGATSQDLKTGYLVGATPRYQQLALFVGVIVSSLVVGFTVAFLDKPTSEQIAQGIQHRIGSEFAAPQATLMATLIKGLLSFNLDWQFVLVGAFIAVTVELCGVKSLSFAVGLYLPLSTTMPIFIGGALKGLVDYMMKRRGDKTEDAELGRGSLLATGLVAGGALMGVIVAFMQASDSLGKWLESISMEHSLTQMLGEDGYKFLGLFFFAAMGYILYRTAMKKNKEAA